MLIYKNNKDNIPFFLEITNAINSGFLWDDIEEVQFSNDLFEFRLELKYFEKLDLLEEKNTVNDENSDDYREIVDDYILSIDNNVNFDIDDAFIYYKLDKIYFIFVLFFLIYNNYILFSLFYIFLGKDMIYHMENEDDEKEELKDTQYLLILDQFIQKAFYSFKNKNFKNKLNLMLDDIELFNFLRNKQYYYNNMHININDITLFINSKNKFNISYLQIIKPYKRFIIWYYNYLLYYQLNSLNFIKNKKLLIIWKKKILNIFYVKNVYFLHKKKNYIIFDNVYYTEYIYQIILLDIKYLYYYKKKFNKCYIII